MINKITVVTQEKEALRIQRKKKHLNRILKFWKIRYPHFGVNLSTKMYRVEYFALKDMFTQLSISPMFARMKQNNDQFIIIRIKSELSLQLIH